MSENIEPDLILAGTTSNSATTSNNNCKIVHDLNHNLYNKNNLEMDDDHETRNKNCKVKCEFNLFQFFF